MVWPDIRSGQYESRNIGRVFHNERSTEGSREPFNNKRFHPGDMLDVAISPNKNYDPNVKKELEKEAKQETTSNSVDEPEKQESKQIDDVEKSEVDQLFNNFGDNKIGKEQDNKLACEPQQVEHKIEKVVEAREPDPGLQLIIAGLI